MEKICFQADTFDDAMNGVLKELICHGRNIFPRRGECKELIGTRIEIMNPRARLSLSEKKGTVFSCLGELSWYLAKTNKLDFIKYYIPRYIENADGDEIHGGYGPRLFEWKSVNQISNIVGKLKLKDSRKAVIQIFDSTDLEGNYKDVPCTCSLQFLLRDDKLFMIAYMRSNDVYIGFPHDVFCFTMLQEIIARTMSVELGSYIHIVGSMHLYKENYLQAKDYLQEGYQSTEKVMPEMPLGDPWDQIEKYLEYESLIRENEVSNLTRIDLQPYWADLVRLLVIFKCSKDKKLDLATQISHEMTTDFYQPFISRKLYGY